MCDEELPLLWQEMQSSANTMRCDVQRDVMWINYVCIRMKKKNDWMGLYFGPGPEPHAIVVWRSVSICLCFYVTNGWSTQWLHKTATSSSSSSVRLSLSPHSQANIVVFYIWIALCRHLIEFTNMDGNAFMRKCHIWLGYEQATQSSTQISKFRIKWA